MSYTLVRTTTTRRMDTEAFARTTSLHPELVRRLVTLGLLEPGRDASGALWFGPDQVAAAARIQRLHLGLGISYASLGLVVDLLDRIAELESALRRAGLSTPRRIGG